MILSSKQALIISASQNKEFFMFDPKTTAVLHKYRDQVTVMPHIAYHNHSQQMIAQQNNKTFISVWDWDSQQPEIKISLTQTMTVLSITPDGHFLIGGSITGNLYYWELPTGILLKKKSLHPTAMISILHFKQNHLITVSKAEVKIWSLYSILIEEDNSPSIKQFNSLLDIVGVAQSRGIVALLTNKNLTLLSPSLNSESRDMQVYQKIDYEFATALAVSNTSAFIGDGKGNIEIVQLFQSQEEKTQLFFKGKGAALQINRAKKKKVLSGSKNPVSCLAFVETLGYLVSGHTNGEVFVWSNQQIKKSLHLFKTTISSISVILKPQQKKIHQTSRIRPLHKYEHSKEEQLLEIIPDYHFEQQDALKTAEASLSAANYNEVILENMLQTLKKPQKLLRQEISALRTERSKLLQANLHYFKLIVP